MASLCYVMPPNLGIEILDYLEMSFSGPGNNTYWNILRTTQVNPVEFQGLVAVFFGEKKPYFFGLGEN